NCDENGNGSVFEPILRVFRRGVAQTPTEVTGTLNRPVDAAPVINRRSLAISAGRVFFRTPEWLGASQGTVAAASGLTGGGATSPPSISADGRLVAFGAGSGSLVGADTNGVADIYVLDRQTSTYELISRATDGTIADNSSTDAAISADGTAVAF